MNNVKQYIRTNLDLVIDYVPRNLNGVADVLARHGRSNPGLT